MGSSKAANAILAKVRAKYGRRLTEKDYASLLSCQQVSEIVSYLKNNTYYSTVLAKVNEKEVHRGRLEVILKQKLFDDFYSLCLYTRGAGEHFSKYILEKNEIEQIIHFLTLLSSGSTDEYIFSMPTYFMSHTSLDLERLARATTYDQFYDAVAGSPYAEILAEFRPKAGERINISRAEHKLYTNCYKNLYNSINRYTSGGERKALTEMFNSIMDYTNFVRVFRLKRYYHEDASATKAYLFPYGSMSKKTIDALCNSVSTADVFASVKDTSFGKKLKKLDYVYAGEIVRLGTFNVTKKNMHFSNFPLVVMMSYIFVMETEYNNIVSIIEGVRYNVDSSKIKSIVIT